MNAYFAGPNHPAPAPRSGITPAVAVLVWVLVGWPVSWFLLFTAGMLGILFGVAITVAMIVVVSTGGRSRPVAPVPVPDHRHLAVRHEVESLAVVTAVGGCGWCGSLAAHVNDDGHPIPPRWWHDAEVEDRIRTKLQH